MSNFKKFFLTLSGENINLSKTEVLSIFELKNVKIKDIKLIDRILVVSCEKNLSDYIAKRAALTHNISEYLIESSVEEKNLLTALNEIDFEEILKSKKNYAVRVQKIGNKSINSEYFERLIGKKIRDKLNSKIKVNLKNPQVLFFAAFVQKKIFFGVSNEQKIRSNIKDKSLNLRPFFHPSALNPRTARVMVNLSQIKENDLFLDPFCGTGSILAEATLIGCKNVMGIDINPKMIKGTKQNLSKYKIRNFNLVLSDSIKIPLRYVSSVSTDPPYGRSSSTHKKALDFLLENFFSEIGNLMLRNKLMTIALPSQINLPNLINKVDFKIIEEFKQYIHSSLTRKIYLIQKK